MNSSGICISPVVLAEDSIVSSGVYIWLHVEKTLSAGAVEAGIDRVPLPADSPVLELWNTLYLCRLCLNQG
jgi:hypothetical protein